MRARSGTIRPVIRKPNVTAGLKWPPEMCPRAETMMARMRPWAAATARRLPPLVMTEPAPTKVSAKAPTNSAALRRKESSSTPPRLEPPPDGYLGPVGLGLDPDGLGDSVHVVEVGDHLDRVVHRRVAPACLPHTVNVGLAEPRGLVRQSYGEIAQLPHPRLEIGLAVIVCSVLR
jgi:hypothetical protein